MQKFKNVLLILLLVLGVVVLGVQVYRLVKPGKSCGCNSLDEEVKRAQLAYYTSGSIANVQEVEAAAEELSAPPIKPFYA